MPIRVCGDLPAKAVIEQENIFIMDENRAIMQDIRPLEIAILNLMPIKHDTEIQLLRALSNTPLQVNVTFVCVESHISKNTPASHLNQFYSKYSEIKDKKYDGLIITGAPVEQLDFEEVNYWEELKSIMEWSKTHVTSTLHICWAAQAGLYYHYGIEKEILEEKLFGIFEHEVIHRKIPLVRGFDDVFLAPHSRYTRVSGDEIKANKICHLSYSLKDNLIKPLLTTILAICFSVSLRYLIDGINIFPNILTFILSAGLSIVVYIVLML